MVVAKIVVFGCVGSSLLLPNVAVMPVLGISPGRILSDLPVYDFHGYPLGDLRCACDRHGLRKFAAEVPAYFSWMTVIRVDPNPDRNSFALGKPILGSALLPHSFHFRFFLQFCQCRRSVIDSLQQKV